MKTSISRIIVIDSDVLYHKEYERYFEKYQDYDLIGIYVCIEDALAAYRKAKPDIIVSEVALPFVSGIDGIKLFKRKNPNVKVIMISAGNDFDMIKKAFKNGANGYLTKPINKKRLYRGLNSVKHEGVTMSNDIVKKVIAMFQRKTYKFFSERENQIVDYLCQGGTYKTIADKLSVTTSTINFHIQNIYLKLDVNSKSEALMKLKELETL